MPKERFLRRRSGNNPLSTNSYQQLEPRRLLAAAISSDAHSETETAAPSEMEPVKIHTVGQFRQAYLSSIGTNFNPAHDYDSNGTVNAVDMLKFQQLEQQRIVPLVGREPIPLTSSDSLPTIESKVVNSFASIGSPTINLSLFDAEGPNPLQADGSLVFDALNAKFVTPNGNGWRHELKIKSSLRRPMTELFEDFSANIKFNLAAGSKVIAVQFHGGNIGTLVKLYVSDHKINSNASTSYSDGVANNGIFDVYVRLSRVDGSGEDVLVLGSIVSGNTIDFRIVNDHGVVTIVSMGVQDTRAVQDSSGSYLKFGNYLQAQDAITGQNVTNSADWAQFYANAGIDHGVITFKNTSYLRIVDTGGSATAPSVSSMVVGNGTTQRSTVNSVTLTIYGLITLVPGAISVIQLSNANGSTDTAVATTHTCTVTGGNTVLTINFASSTRNSSGALNDGHYQLMVDGTKVKRSGSNVAMSQNYVFGAASTDNFFSFFGDSNGDRNINAIDLLSFRQTYGKSAGVSGYNVAMDYDSNGSVNALDLLRFRERYGKMLQPPGSQSLFAAILNPGFEDGFIHWVENEPVAESGVTSSGSKSAKVGLRGRISQVIEVKPNTTDRLSAMVEGGGRLGVTVAGNAFDSIGLPGQNYLQHSVVFATGSANSILIFGEADSEEARFDDFSIVQV